MVPPGADPRPFGFEPYAPPSADFRRPAVILWFRVWAATTLTVYLAFLAFLGVGQVLTPRDPAAADSLGFFVVLAVFTLVFGGLLLLGALVPYRPWGWTAGLVAICFGLTSCTAPFAVPLLVYWLKPTTRAAFGRL